MSVSEEGSLAAAVDHLRAGGLLAYPTETVWGLGADAGSAEAVAALRRWKGRDDDQPLSILVPDLAAAEALGFRASGAARALAARFWPGPLTLVLPAPAGRFAAGVAGADGSVGLRCSPEPLAQALASAVQRAGAGPVTATSLNRSGEPPARSLADARALCEAHPGPRIVGPGGAGRGSCATPSTVVVCTGPGWKLLREGAIPVSALHAASDGPNAPRGEASPR